MRPLVNCWSPLTHASRCMTISRPAAATQMRVKVSPAMKPNVFLHWMAFLLQPISELGTSLEYAGLHTLRQSG